jgi:hypothetical protein
MMGIYIFILCAAFFATGFFMGWRDRGDYERLER